MIEIICGEKGTGKTKRIISLANSISDKAKGSMVFIDDDNSYMYDLGYSIRFINVTDYALSDPDMFLGFLSGMLAVNYDITLVCVDAFLKLIKSTPIEETEGFFSRLNSLGEHSNVRFVLNVSCDIDALPAFIKQYVI